MSRSGALASDWYFLGRVRPLEEISARARRPDPRVGLGLRRRFAGPRRPDRS